MTVEDVIRLVRPEVLVYFEEDLFSGIGVLIPKGALIGLRLGRADSFGYEILAFDHPTAAGPCANVTPNDLAGKVRGASADEERSWIARA